VPLPAEERLELRPARRFDSAEAVARLTVLPMDADGTRSRGGWTVPVVPLLRKRMDRATAILLAVWGAAALVAVAIVVV